MGLVSICCIFTRIIVCSLMASVLDLYLILDFGLLLLQNLNARSTDPDHLFFLPTFSIVPRSSEINVLFQTLSSSHLAISLSELSFRKGNLGLCRAQIGCKLCQARSPLGGLPLSLSSGELLSELPS